MLRSARSSRALRRYATQSKSTDGPPTRAAALVLEDGTRFEGKSFGAHKSVSGECVFQTGMVGYTESLTDPSYTGQLLTCTTPMVGNYGVPGLSAANPKRLDAEGLPYAFESNKIHAKALVVQDYSHHYSHWDAVQSLGAWLETEGVPGICGVDTRMLTKKIRDTGAMPARIEVEGDADAHLLPFGDVHAENLVALVSTKETIVYGKGNPTRVLAVDCGMKHSIVRQLVARGAEVTVVPWDFPIQDHIASYDGLFLSNGPGDPAMCKATVDNLREVLKAEGEDIRPIFGICLGNQLLGIAAGGQTTKLPFGNRGQNQPVMNMLTGEAYITPQNHGFAVDSKSIPDEWQILFENINDGSNEGLCHSTKPYFTAQFHPEACAGPTDTAFLFDVFLKNCQTQEKKLAFPEPRKFMPKPDVKKVLLLGSGGLSIGQAGEFDYSGSQAIKALKEEGIQVVLMNPNIASVQTNVGGDPNMQADQVFFMPVTPVFVEQVIRRERPDAILISMGGQTALNCGIELDDLGIFEKYGVKVLGTSIETVIATEDREIFNDKLREIDEKCAPSIATDNIEGAVKAANDPQIGFPCMIRSAFALGGLGSGICEDEEMLRDMAAKALSMSPQILVERSMLGWKEVEYEVVRDGHDNCVTVCNMENFDPLGVHTGDSIVIAPSQTLSNTEYHMLRDTAINVVRHLGIIGECNIQYALHPTSLDYVIIEVNPRLSRSSALASKATGYPLAFVAAKLGLGITLPEVENAVTKTTKACFEPSLDYCVTKVPRWDMSKFDGVSTKIGSAMKSVGEVMSIGRTWEESIQKALRMVDPSVKGFEPTAGDNFTLDQIKEELVYPSDRRVFAIATALRDKLMTVDEIHELSRIDHWFLRRLERIANEATEELSQVASLKAMTETQMRSAKGLGFSDNQIARLVTRPGDGKLTDMDVRAVRKTLGVTPVTKQIDTLAGEVPAKTNYLYMTYHGSEDDIGDESKDSIVVLGSGAYRIGSSVEFDWCGVSAIRTLRNLGYTSTMINYNPETVSTDYDECDQLYFEELSRERVMDVYEREEAAGVIVSVGGQIPQNLAMPLHQAGIQVLGTPPEMIDAAEDRSLFSAKMDAAGVQQPAWTELKDRPSAYKFAEMVSYPVLVRPSYVLSGAAMNVAHNQDQLEKYLDMAVDVSPEHPVVLTKFVMGAKEVELDAVAKNGEMIACAIHEHIENAGVHSGDATLLLPPQSLTEYTIHRVREAGVAMAKALNITGPFNAQFIAKDSDVMAIECNLRASRSVPFVSKTVGVDFIEAATKAMVNFPTADMNLPLLEKGDAPRPAGYVGVKSPMFSFTRLRGADPTLGVEMASTGEVACFGANLHEAWLKALLSTGFKLPERKILVSVPGEHYEAMVPELWRLADTGYELVATPKTFRWLQSKGVPCELARLPYDEEDVAAPNVMPMLTGGEIDLVINLPNAGTPGNREVDNDYKIRRTAVDFGIPLLTNGQLVKLFSEAMEKHKKGELIGVEPESLFDFYSGEKEGEAWTKPTEFH